MLENDGEQVEIQFAIFYRQTGLSFEATSPKGSLQSTFLKFKQPSVLAFIDKSFCMQLTNCQNNRLRICQNERSKHAHEKQLIRVGVLLFDAGTIKHTFCTSCRLLCAQRIFVVSRKHQANTSTSYQHTMICIGTSQHGLIQHFQSENGTFSNIH
jgi:hypothetical protein